MKIPSEHLLNFLSGLKDELRIIVTMFKPNTLAAAFGLARPIKRISPNQMQERREKGLCYFCDDRYQPGELQAELLGISLHAIAGAPSPKTMRIIGKIGNSTVIVLIDTGSTHSFVDVKVARREKMQVVGSKMAVQVANGDTLSCPGCLGGCDVVLGVDWLRSLGTIKWNFADLHMKFSMHGKEHTLQGLKQPPSRSQDHQIQLHAAANPTNLRPYRYPCFAGAEARW